MSAIAAQHAYLLWLKERGLRSPMPARTGEVERPVPAAAPTCPAPAPRRTRALFVADGLLAGIADDFDAGERSDAAMLEDERALLDKMIAAMQLGSDEAIVMRLMPMPLDAKTPPPAPAVTQALQQLVQQVQSLRPEAVVLLGAWTARAVLGSKAHFATVRGRLVEVRALGGCPALVTFHPRDLLRFPLNKRHAWTDLQQLMARLGIAAVTH